MLADCLLKPKKIIELDPNLKTIKMWRLRVRKSENDSFEIVWSKKTGLQRNLDRNWNNLFNIDEIVQRLKKL